MGAGSGAGDGGLGLVRAEDLLSDLLRHRRLRLNVSKEVSWIWENMSFSDEDGDDKRKAFYDDGKQGGLRL